MERGGLGNSSIGSVRIGLMGSLTERDETVHVVAVDTLELSGWGTQLDWQR